ncbi:MAG: hypothetical protein MUC50_11020, partial [Myxococcota bacterium]|nr:hypothetical protein [Myxococcota bacterium]
MKSLGCLICVLSLAFLGSCDAGYSSAALDGFGEDTADDDGSDTSPEKDRCPTDPKKLDPGKCGCGIPDEDADKDGMPDCYDECPTDAKKVEPGDCGCGMPDDDTNND